jgi:hypothetical protein
VIHRNINIYIISLNSPQPLSIGSLCLLPRVLGKDAEGPVEQEHVDDGLEQDGEEEPLWPVPCAQWLIPDVGRTLQVCTCSQKHMDYESSPSSQSC